ncbi:DUF1707 SHOCT-like domain-containing protein [Cryptosporangium aurantiacum]|uniref:DUF1707 domain-containing protein n=1 Tax=Cryptosporangium aurantiacum TaxID=134849 RepID=A0A1M7R9Q7_9ACTN|nr:DUF1707 domain-containing protein [Cryptosporangium aurantiacum]SHN42768.1 protein of unknown function [Cryptosporangium aurantiacum]
MATLPEPTSPGHPETGVLRASNADRERVAAALHEAAAEGRIDLNELDARLAQVYSARTYAELQPLTVDLPAPRAEFVPAPPEPHGLVLPPSRSAVAIMSGFKRSGRWTVTSKFECLAFWGGGTIDLRDAVFTEGTVTIRAVAIMGGIDVIAPENATVHVTGLGIMGGFDHGASAVGTPGAPMIVVTGFAFWGGVSVKRRPSKAEAERRRLERKRLKAEKKAQDEISD